jgi:hypothetical protein
VLVLVGGGATVNTDGAGVKILPQAARYAEPRPSIDILRKSRRENLVFIAMILSLCRVSISNGHVDQVNKNRQQLSVSGFLELAGLLSGSYSGLIPH